MIMIDSYADSLYIKSEEEDVAVWMPDLKFAVKEEIDIEKEIEIGPTELQRPDRFYKFQPANLEKENKNDTVKIQECFVYLERHPKAEIAASRLLLNSNILEEYECNACSKSFQSKELLITHLYLDHINSVMSAASARHSKCYKCGKVLADREGLRRHLMHLHTREAPHECRFCPRRFKDPRYRSNHEKRVHEKLKPHKCSFCEKSFFGKYHMQLHQLVHTGERPFKCTVCDKAFNRTHVLESHMFIHTGEKPYECEYCDFSCRDQPTLRKHTRRHMNTHKTFACAACNKRYDNGNRLRAHIASVHARMDKQYECQHCKKKFSTKSTLVVHINAMHTRAVMWECGICHRRFTRPSNLDTHIARHSLERPHKCAECGSKFKTQGDLSKHSRIHKPAQFVCGLCGHGFHRTGHLNKHLRVIHNHTP